MFFFLDITYLTAGLCVQNGTFRTKTAKILGNKHFL